MICDYCTSQATRITYSDEPLCMGCARDHYGPALRRETKLLGVQAQARLIPDGLTASLLGAL